VFQISSRYDKAAGRVVIDAKEVQPRDSLTGFFDVDVNVEIRTDSGVVTMVVPVRNGNASAGVNVKAAPRSVRWDKGSWILSLTDFPRSTNMLAYELTHDDDVLGRIEAVALLGERADDQIATAAVIAASHDDSYRAVRQQATVSLGIWKSRSGSSPISPEYVAVQTALLDASRDADAGVRQNAAGMLFMYPGSESSARAHDLAASDPNPYVRGAALASYVRLEKAAALPLVREVLPQDTWANVIRRPVLVALRELNTPEAQALVEKYTPPALQRF
jgi:aminopeptidase N